MWPDDCGRLRYRQWPTPCVSPLSPLRSSPPRGEQGGSNKIKTNHQATLAPKFRHYQQTLEMFWLILSKRTALLFLLKRRPPAGRNAEPPFLPGPPGEAHTMERAPRNRDQRDQGCPAPWRSSILSATPTCW